MSIVTISGGTTAPVSGSDIALSGADALFTVLDGETEFSTDGGATWKAKVAGDEIVFYDGDTISVRNKRPVLTRFSYMDY